MRQSTLISAAAIWTLASFTAGVGALAADLGSDDEAAVVSVEPVPKNSKPADDPATQLPAAGQLQVAGPVGSFSLTAANGETIAPPFTFEPVERGSGNGAEIVGVLVGDDLVSINWDAGRPLVLGGDGGLLFDRARFSLANGQVSVEAGGTVADVGPGEYRIDTPIAVGRQGLAQPLDAVNFRVGGTELPTMEFRGGVSARLRSEPLFLVGPGTGSIEGQFVVTNPDGTEVGASRLELGPDVQFEIRAAPLDTGWIIEAKLQGVVTIS